MPPDRFRVTAESPPDDHWSAASARHDAEVHARALLEAAERLALAAEQPGSSPAIPEVLEATADALRTISRACYTLAADAAPDVAPRPFPIEPRDDTPDAPPREWQMALTTALHEAAVGMARSGRLCNASGSRARQLLERWPVIDRIVAKG